MVSTKNGGMNMRNIKFRAWNYAESRWNNRVTKGAVKDEAI